MQCKLAHATAWLLWLTCALHSVLYPGADGSAAAKGHRCTAFTAVKDDVINAGAEWADEPVVVSERTEGSVREIVITSRTPADLTPFCHAIIDAIA